MTTVKSRYASIRTAPTSPPIKPGRTKSGSEIRCCTIRGFDGIARAAREHGTRAPERNLNSADAVERFAGRVDELAGCASFEEAAQRFCDLFYTDFPDTALVRIFGTVAFANLGNFERRAVATFVERIGASGVAGADDPVLTLFGTRGIEPAWCSRTTSRDHLAIPLLSQHFVAEIPMISRLLAELGFSQLEAGEAAWQFVSRPSASRDGLFFVGDARTTTDERGRLIIPSSQFVDRYRVRTVFGFGGPAVDGAMLLTAIVFCRSIMTRQQAAAFVNVMGRLRAATHRVLERQRLFASAP
jgi:hypothetical protein